MSGSTLTFRTPAPQTLFFDDGDQDFASAGVEGTPSAQADAFLIAESDSNPDQPARAEVSAHAGNGDNPDLGPFVRLGAETGTTRFFDLQIKPNVDDTTPTLQLTLPANDVDVAPTAGAIVAYLRITAAAGAGLPGGVYKIPLYAVA